MEYRDYYKTLGVSKNASEKEIKSAYRKLARKYHPDVNSDKNAESRFKEINEAYEVLGDSQKRSKYDQLGSNWNRWQQTGGNSANFNWGDWMNAAGSPYARQQNARYTTVEDLGDLFGSGGGGGFSDFFTAIFGGMAGAQQPRDRTRTSFNNFTAQPQPRQKLEHEIEISLTEAYRGTSRQISVNGRKLDVKIPAGVKTGTKVRAPRNENLGIDGDLFLKMKVSSDPRFERKGDNLYVDAPVDLYTAILGGEVRVPTMTGDINLKIPAGSQNEQKIRLRGKGMPKLRKSNEHGDMFVKINVRLPKNISDEQRKLFEQLRQLDK